MMYMIREREMLSFIEPVDLVHKLNIAKCHGKIIEEIFKNLDISNCKSKRVRDYMKKSEIVMGLQETLIRFPNSINFQIIKWFISLDCEFLFDIDKAIEHQKEVEELYNISILKKMEQLELYGLTINLNKKCW